MKFKFKIIFPLIFSFILFTCSFCVFNFSSSAASASDQSHEWLNVSNYGLMASVMPLPISHDLGPFTRDDFLNEFNRVHGYVPNNYIITYYRRANGITQYILYCLDTVTSMNVYDYNRTDNNLTFSYQLVGSGADFIVLFSSSTGGEPYIQASGSDTALGLYYDSSGVFLDDYNYVVEWSSNFFINQLQPYTNVYLPGIPSWDPSINFVPDDTSVNNIFDNITDYIDNINVWDLDSIGDLLSLLLQPFKFIVNFCKTFFSNLTIFFESILSWFNDNFLTPIVDFFAALFENGISVLLPNDFFDFFEDLFHNGISVLLPDVIIDIYTQFYNWGIDSDGEFSLFLAIRRLFIPDQLDFHVFTDFIDGNVNSVNGMTNVYLNSYISFLNNISTGVTPVITIPSFNFLGSTISGFTLEFDWLIPYLPVIKSLILAFAWLTFIIDFVKKIPGIISGVGGQIQDKEVDEK